MEVLILEEIFSSRCLFIAGLVGVVGCLLDVFDCVELWRLSKKDNELTDVIALFRKLLQLKPGKQLRSNNNYS